MWTSMNRANGSDLRRGWVRFFELVPRLPGVKLIPLTLRVLQQVPASHGRTAFDRKDHACNASPVHETWPIALPLWRFESLTEFDISGSTLPTFDRVLRVVAEFAESHPSSVMPAKMTFERDGYRRESGQLPQHCRSSGTK